MSNALPGQITPPPRLTGNDKQDIIQLLGWAWDLYSKLELTQLFVTFAEQFGATSFDPTSLPNPSNTTIAQAQETANNAFILAVAALNDLGFNGQFTIAGLATTIVETFAAAEVDTNYNVVATPVALTGVPAAGAFVINKIDKTVDDFTVTFEAAPGAATDVTYDFQLRR